MQVSIAQQGRIATDQLGGARLADGARSSPASIRERAASVLDALLTNRHLPIAVALLSVLGMISALTGGWQLDDYFQRATLLGYGDAKPINTFVQYIDRAHNLAQLDYGTLPWWGSPDLHMAFFRYASTLTMMLDYRLWPNHPALMHLQSLLWLAAAVLAAALLYREVMGATWIAGLAALMYAIDGAHAVPAAYIANRNALIAGCFGFLSILEFVRWRRLGGWRSRSLSMLMFALALCAGEMGLASVAYLVSYAVTIDTGGIRTRIMRLLPHGGVLGAWALIYKLGNFGSQGSGFYVDPLHNPLGFGGAFCQRALFLLMGQWTPIPAELSMAFAPGSSTALHMSEFSFAVAALLLVLFIPLILRDRVVRFWGLGLMLSLIPISAVGPENRLLGFVGLGSMALLAQVTQFLFTRAYPGLLARIWQGFAWAATLLLLATHLVAAPLLGIARIAYLKDTSSRMTRAIASVPTDSSIASQELVLIDPPDHIYLVTAIWAVHLLQKEPMPRHLRALSTGGTIEVTRVGPRSLQVSFPDGFFPTAFSHYVRSPNDRFSTGQRLALPGMTVVVESLDAHGDPERVLYKFPVPLEDPSLRWMRWKDGVYVPWTPPAVGKTARFSPQAGIF